MLQRKENLADFPNTQVNKQRVERKTLLISEGKNEIVKLQDNYSNNDGICTKM